MSQEFQQSTIHVEGKSDFDFLGENQIISVGYDSLLYVFDCIQMERIHNSELECQVGAIAVHPCNPNIFTLGGTNSKVITYDNQELVGGDLIYKFSGTIHRIRYSQDGKYVALASEENTLALFNYDSQLTTKCRPPHDGMTLNACFDPMGRYVLSLGCDGQGLLYQLSETPQLIRKYKISKDVSPNSAQIMQADWNPNGKLIALPGQNHLQIIQISDDPEDLQSLYSVSHQKEISIVMWVSEGGIITVGMDKVVKLWHFSNERNVQLVWQNTFDSLIQQIRLSPSKTKLYILDSQGNLHWTNIDVLALTQSIIVPESNKRYQEVYSTTENALSDLMKKKVRPQTAINEEIQIDEDSQEIQVDLKETQLDKPKLVKPKQLSSELSNIIDMKPQNTLLSTKTESLRGTNDKKFLLQNNIGSVRSASYTQDDKTNKIIEVDFFDKTSHQPLKFANDQNFEMAAMNYRGLILASKGPNNRDLEEDGYMNDEIANEPSKIYYESFFTDIDKNKYKFILNLPNSEGAESICIGNDWFGVATDTGIIHIFGFSGIEIYSFSLMRPLVAIVAYENLLIAAYLNSVPMFGCQMIRANMYDVDNRSQIRELDVCLTLYSELEWFGFSEDGVLITQDSKNAIWGYIFQEDRWVQINVGHCQDKKFWLFGANEYTMIGYLINSLDRYPDAIQQPLPETRDFELSSICDVHPQTSIYSQTICLKEFTQSHEYFRFKMFSHLNESRLDKYDPLIKYSQSIWNAGMFKTIEDEINILKFKVFNHLLINNQYQEILEYYKSHVNSLQLMNSVISFIQKKSTNPKLSERIIQLQKEKIIKMNLDQNQNYQDDSDIKPIDKGPAYGLKRPVYNMSLNTKQISHQPNLTKAEEVKRQTHQQQSNYPKPEEIKQQKNNPFASKQEANQSSSIFEQVNQQQEQENNRKRKPVSAISQTQFGKSTILEKKN